MLAAIMSVRITGLLIVLLAVIGTPAPIRAQAKVMPRIFISTRQSPARTGHDSRRLTDDFWQEMVKRRAVVSAGLIFPTTAQIHQQDVLVLYGDRVLDLNESQRTDLEVYLQRGGGLVVIHNTVASPGAASLANRLGMRWIPDQSRWEGGVARFTELDADHPITRGLKPFVLAEELGEGVELLPTAHVLAKGGFRDRPATPQFWTVETAGQRTVVILPGHNYAAFEQPEFRVLLLRAMAWAGKFDPDILLLPDELARFSPAPAEVKQGKAGRAAADGKSP